MKICGIICEYNPFHSGHAYMIRELRETYGMEHIVCFMSGNYVQRGEPAVLDKYRRAEAALLSGADLVFEMPAEFSTASSREFANCGISMLLHTGFCSHLAFGLEPGIDLLKLNEYRKKAACDSLIKERLENGCTYPEAVFGKENVPGPNTILGCAYLDALEKFDSEHRINIQPIVRSGDGYLEETVSGTAHASAAALRKYLKEGKTDRTAPYIPYSLEREIFCFPDMLSGLLNDRILRETEFCQYLDVSREIADRLQKQKYRSCSFTERVELLKTRQYTRSRISRTLLHIVLGIRKDHVNAMIQAGYCPYYRVLAYRRDSGLLKELAKEGNYPVYTKNARFYESFPDVLYYDQIWHNTTGTGTELTRTPVIL